MTHRAKIVATGSTPVSSTGVAMTIHGTPSFLNISSNVLKATGLTKLWFMSATTGHKHGSTTHYPSTPASKALRLSSRVDIPVRARIRVPLPFGSVDSILRISFVAPTPSSSGIDMSRSTILMFDGQNEEPGSISLFRNALESSFSLEHPYAITSVNGSNCVISLISNEQDQRSRNPQGRQRAPTLVLSHFILRKRRPVRLDHRC